MDTKICTNCLQEKALFKGTKCPACVKREQRAKLSTPPESAPNPFIESKPKVATPIPPDLNGTRHGIPVTSQDNWYDGTTPFIPDKTYQPANGDVMCQGQILKGSHLKGTPNESMRQNNMDYMSHAKYHTTTCRPIIERNNVILK